MSKKDKQCGEPRDYLVSCPCCGGEGYEKKTYEKFPHGWVGCPACHLYINWTYDDRWAIARWNQRVNSDVDGYLKRWEAEKRDV